jgi:hypothetical protein
MTIAALAASSQSYLSSWPHLPHAPELKERERLEKDAIHLLSRIVFRRMSNLVLFNIRYFCVGERKDADEHFQQALNQELIRRGLLKSNNLTKASVDLDKFTDYDMTVVKCYFDPDPDRPTREDLYVELLTGRTRFVERKQKRWTAETMAGNDDDED